MFRSVFLLLAVLILALVTGCVEPQVAVSYAERAYPECSGFWQESHNYGGSHGSQTEVSMQCPDQTRRKSVTVKCIHGWGIISDTTCHENN